MRSLRQRTAVIGLAAAARSHHDLNSARRDLQLAFVLRDRVVVGLEVRAFRVLDRVRHFAFSNRRHRTSRLDLRGFAFHEPVAAHRYSGFRQSRAVVRLLTALRRQRYSALRDRQLAGGEGGVIIIGSNVHAAPGDCEGFGKGTGVGAVGHMGALGGGVGDGQDVVLTEAFDLVIIGLDGSVGAGNGRHKGTAFLLGAVIHLFDVLDRDREGRLGDREGAEVFFNRVVIRVDAIPIDGVGIILFARIGDGTSGGNGNLVLVRCNQTGKGRFVLGQRRAVVGLCVATRFDGQLGGQDLQTAGTDVQVDTVVIILRQIRQRDRNGIGVIAGVFLRNAVIMQTSSVLIIGRLGLYRIPDIIQIFCLIACIADHDIVFDSLAGIREAGFIQFAVISCTRPAVGLDTDRYTELRYLKGTADVAESIVVGVVIEHAINHSTARGDDRSAGIDTAIVGSIVRISVAKAQLLQGMTIQKPINDGQFSRCPVQYQGCSVILLCIAGRGDSDLLLVIQVEHQIAGAVKDLVVGAGSSAVALHRPVEHPAGDGRAGQGIRIADLHGLDVRIDPLDRVTVHVKEVHGDLGGLVAGVIERKNVVLCSCRQSQALLFCIGIEVHPLIGVGQHVLVDCSSRLDDKHRIAVDLVALVRGDLDLRAVGLGGVDQITDRIAGRFRLRSINEGDLICTNLQRHGLARRIGPHACDAHGLLDDFLTLFKVRVGDSLVIRHTDIILAIDLNGIGVLCGGFTHIVDGIAQRFLRPVGVDRDIPGDLGRPVKELVAVSRGIPAVEMIAEFGGIRLRDFDHLALFDRLIGLLRCAAVHIKGDGIAGGRPLSIQHQVGSRHGGEGILSRQAGIGIPAGEGVVAVHTALGRRGRPNVRRLVNISVELDIFNGIKVRAAIVVVDLEGVAVVI